MNRKKIFETGAHILFSILLIYWFYHNSFIRPYTILHPYKEIISALLLLLAIYLNYLILVPHFIKKSYYKSYISLSILLLVVIATMEFVIVKNDILRCVYHDESFDLDHYLYRILFVIFLRNASFYLFFTVLKLYQQTKAIALIEKKEALKHDGLVLLMPLRGAPVSINIKYVCYFSHEKNLTFIHNTFGKVTSVYSTLKNILEYLGDYCLQINKENIITYTNIIRYNNDTVTIKEGKGNKQKLLTYYKKDVPNILNKLREKVPDLEEKNTKFSHQNHFDGVNDDKRHKSGGLKNEILEEITNNPGISVVIIAQKMKEKASLRTIERKLKELKKSEHIVYRGSDKTGGYYLV